MNADINAIAMIGQEGGIYNFFTMVGKIVTSRTARAIANIQVTISISREVKGV